MPLQEMERQAIFRMVGTWVAEFARHEVLPTALVGLQKDGNVATARVPGYVVDTETAVGMFFLHALQFARHAGWCDKHVMQTVERLLGELKK